MGSPNRLDALERVTMRTRGAWRKWLQSHHHSSEGVWLITYKKASGMPYLAYADVVEEALCFGWIDGLRRPLDEERTMLHVSPRRPKSVWSKPNRERVERLIANGLMQPAGLEKIERARRDGSWSYLDDADALVIPADLSEAFAACPGSREGFDALSESIRRRMLHFLKDAKGASTRQKRVERIMGMISTQKGRPKAAPLVADKPCVRNRSAG